MKCLSFLGMMSASVLALVAGASGLDREAFTFTRYDLSLRIEPEQQRLGVRGRITLRNDSSRPQRIAALQISSTLNWRSIRVASLSSEPGLVSKQSKALQYVSQPFASDIDHTSDLSEALVTLPQEVAPKESVTLDISYEGVVLLDTTRLTRIGTPEAVARHIDWDQIGKTYTAMRGIGYVAWYPVAIEAQSLSEGDAMFAALGKWKARHAESVMELQVEVLASSAGSDRLAVLSNAQGCKAQNESVEGGAALSGCRFDALGFAEPTLVVGNFETTDSKMLQVRYFSQHDLSDHGAGAAELVKAAEGIAPLVQDWFGVARAKAKVVELSDVDAAPFEAGDLLLLPLGTNDPKLEQVLLAHQLTHAAFASSRLWIREGAAHFAQALVREKQNGREAALAYMERHRAAVLAAEKASDGEALVNATDETFYRSKAALVWWMLRDMVGDAVLKRALRAYVTGEDRDAMYFGRLLEEHSKKDLSWFFHDWVYADAGLPDFRIESTNARQGSGANFVTAVTIENTGGAGAEMPVTVRTANGDFMQRLEVRGKSKAVIRIATPSEPLEVVVNDGSVPESDITNNRGPVSKNQGSQNEETQ